MGRRGTLVIGSELRRAYGLEEGVPVIQEPTPDGILVRLAATVPIRTYTPEDKAMFLLNNAATAAEYAAAREEVRRGGLDPDRIKHAAFPKSA